MDKPRLALKDALIIALRKVQSKDNDAYKEASSRVVLFIGAEEVGKEGSKVQCRPDSQVNPITYTIDVLR